MFDSQYCSIATITFLVQVVGLATAVGFRLNAHRIHGWHLAGLGLGFLVMAGSTIACLMVDTSSGMIQAVALVGVAIGTTLDFSGIRSREVI